tara:strand:- start:2817 stop:4250 length:1434 start_codon:yes stop_codon:yes gene_type:complete
MRDYYKPSRTYIGQVVQDRHGTQFEHGLGFYNLPLTGKCAADFDHSKVTGMASKEWDHGETYVGQYLLDKKQGYGVHVWPTGARYYGQFSNNKPCGYGVLETVHEGVKFIGRVDGMIAEPREGQWYLNDVPCGLEECNIDGLGCRTLDDGTIVNAVGGRTTTYKDEQEFDVTRHEEKNFVTETKHVPPYNFIQGKRDTTHYGDWIRTAKGHFLSGRHHGRIQVQQLGQGDYESNFLLGTPVDFETYSSIAFDMVDNTTRSVERRMQRRYCAVYDLIVKHLKRTNKIFGLNENYTIVELGIGRGEHLQFLQKLFPQATIIGVDKLTPTSIPENALERQQVEDLKIASKIEGVKLELGVNCYSPNTCKQLMNKYGPVDFAIHDATHGVTAWKKLHAVKNLMNPQRGILVSEEMCCTPDIYSHETLDQPQLDLARKGKWRIWDMRPQSYWQYKNALIGIWSPKPENFEADELGLYEVGND